RHPPSSTLFPYTTLFRSLVITTPLSYLASGLSGTVAVSTPASSFYWGVPNANATTIATLADGSGHPAIFAYEKGAGMVGVTAPRSEEHTSELQSQSNIVC